ncbi:MAG: hypothetical protein KBT68_00245, partial [bacterium]|nr:hypothetical protein [Candidatus Colisoma equi]
ASEWKRFGVVLRRDFTWSAQILLAVFKPRSFRSKRMPRAFSGRVAPDAFRRQVIDRILVLLRGLLARLRESAQLIDQKVERFPSPVWNGLRAAVQNALSVGTRGLLMVRLADGRYDYFDSGQCGRWNESSSWFDRQETAVDVAVERLKRSLRQIGRVRSIGEYAV